MGMSANLGPPAETRELIRLIRSAMSQGLEFAAPTGVRQSGGPNR